MLCTTTRISHLFYITVLDARGYSLHRPAPSSLSGNAHAHKNDRRFSIVLNSGQLTRKMEELYNKLAKLNVDITSNAVNKQECRQRLIELNVLMDNIKTSIDSSLNAQQKVCVMTISNTLTLLANKTYQPKCVSPPSAQPPLDIEGFHHKTNSNGFNSLVGMKNVINKINAMFILPLHQPQLFKTQNRFHNLLLYGPPGCGKTQLVYALSEQINAKLFCLTPGNLMDSYVGGTEKRIQGVFNSLRNTTEPTILFIDEIDAFCRARTDNEQEHNRRVKIEFMNQLTLDLKDSKLIVIAATNVPWNIDSAVLRRFHQKIYLGLPDRQQRDELLKFFLGDNMLELFYIDQMWSCLLNITEGYTNSDLKEVIRTGLLIPIEELLQVTVWTPYQGTYSPADLHENKENVTCSVYDLPPDSVRARALNVTDFLESSQESVHRTVTDEEIEKFAQFRKKHK